MSIRTTLLWGNSEVNHRLLKLITLKARLSNITIIYFILSLVIIKFFNVGFPFEYVFGFLIFLYLMVHDSIKKLKQEMRNKAEKIVALKYEVIVSKRFGLYLVHTKYPNQSFSFYEKIKVTSLRQVIGYYKNDTYFIAQLPGKAQLVRRNDDLLIFKP